MRSRRQHLPQEHACLYPVALDRPLGDLQDRGNLLVRQAAEEPILNDACEARIDHRNAIERVGDLEQRVGCVTRADGVLVERDAAAVAAALYRATRLCAIGEDV